MNRGFNYLGTVDDRVLATEKWKFEVNEEAFNLSLARQVILGRPVLLNDGYLVLNPICTKQLWDTTSLFYQLLDKDFIKIMARGYKTARPFGIHEMPEKFQGIESYRRLIAIPEWKSYKAKLAKFDERAQKLGYYAPWHRYDTNTGYRAFAEALSKSNNTKGASALGAGVRKTVLRDFLREFIDKVEASTGQEGRAGPRDIWTKLVEQYAGMSDRTSAPQLFRSALLRLGNEIYHYNMGVSLCSSFECPISVETQASGLFEDIVSKPAVLVDRPEDLDRIPTLHVPKQVVNLPTSMFVALLDEGTAVGGARMQFLDAQDRLAQAERGVSQALMGDWLGGDPYITRINALREASNEYAARLAEFFGPKLPLTAREGFLDVAYDLTADAVVEGAKDASKTVVAAAGATAGAAVAGPAGFVIGGIAAYAIARGLAKGTEGLVRRFRIYSNEKILLGSDVFSKMKSLVGLVKNQRIPSALDLDPAVAKTFTDQMKPFFGRA